MKGNVALAPEEARVRHVEDEVEGIRDRERLPGRLDAPPTLAGRPELDDVVLLQPRAHQAPEDTARKAGRLEQRSGEVRVAGARRAFALRPGDARGRDAVRLNGI